MFFWLLKLNKKVFNTIIHTRAYTYMHSYIHRVSIGVVVECRTQNGILGSFEWLFGVVVVCLTQKWGAGYGQMTIWGCGHVYDSKMGCWVRANGDLGLWSCVWVKNGVLGTGKWWFGVVVVCMSQKWGATHPWLRARLARSKFALIPSSVQNFCPLMHKWWTNRVLYL